MFNEKDTKQFFINPIKQQYYDYLLSRGVNHSDYLSALREGNVGILNENVILIGADKYSVNCILGMSNESIFDIIGTNALYGLTPDRGTVIAVLYGDDYIFYKPNDHCLYLSTVSNIEVSVVAESFTEFLTMIHVETNDQSTNAESTTIQIYD